MLHCTACSDSVCLVVQLRDDGLTQLLIVGLVAILALNIFAEFLHQLNLCSTMCLDSLVSILDSAEHNLLANLLHLTLNHQDIIDSTSDHNVEVYILHLRESWVNAVLSVDSCYTHLRDWTSERNVRYSQSCRSSQTCEGISLNILVRRDKIYSYINLCVVVSREQWAERTVNKTSNQNLIVAGLTLTLHKTARNTTYGSKLLLVFDLQRHKVSTLFCVFGSHYRCEQHRIALFYDNRTVSLLCQLAGLNHYLATTFQRDKLLYSIVQLLFFHNHLNRQKINFSFLHHHIKKQNEGNSEKRVAPFC